jgi:hypothetical protein
MAKRNQFAWAAIFGLVISNLAAGVNFANEYTAASAPFSVSADSIISRLEAANRVREVSLQAYSATRTYRAQAGMGKKAELQAMVDFESPSTKRFRVLSEEGAGIFRQTVFRRMMQAEVDALQPEQKRRSALSPENYRFKLAGEHTVDGYRCWVLEAEPLREDKYLFRGRIYVDSRDFALVRVEGSPAKMPSFWTKKIGFIRDYRKIRGYWLPVRDESVTQVRLFGESVVTVDHSNYRLGATGNR